MSLQKSEAVVLKTQKLGETSKVLTLYSREFGKIKVVAKGSRGLKSRFYGTLEPLNHIFIVYYFKETRDLQLLSQAEIMQPFNAVRQDLNKYGLGSLFCELIDRTQLEQANKYLFQLLLDGLKKLDETSANLVNIYFWFILRLLHISGFRPHFDKCHACGRRVVCGNVRFSIISGNFVCPDCQRAEPMSISAAAESIVFLEKLQTTAIKNIDTFACPSIEECETLLLSFMQYHIEETRILKSLKFMKNIQHNSRL